MAFHPFIFTSINDFTTWADNANTPTYALGGATTALLTRLSRAFHRRRDAALHARLDEHSARHDAHTVALAELTRSVALVHDHLAGGMVHPVRIHIGSDNDGGDDG